MVKKLLLILPAIVIILGGCVVNRLDKTPRTMVLRPDSDGTSVVIEVTGGGAFSNRLQAGPLIFNVLPQMAIWLEDGEGRFIETLYVTGADFRKFNHAEKNEDGAAFFAANLPLWSSRIKSAGQELPSKDNPYPDTITSATPTGSFSIITATPSVGGVVNVYVEINKSGDYNQNYPKEKTGNDGQPSLIYSAELKPPFKGEPVKMRLAGHGGGTAEPPGVFPELSGLDTALRQIDEISISLRNR